MRHFSEEWWRLGIVPTPNYLTLLFLQIVNKHFENMPRYRTYLIPDNYSWKFLFSHTFRSSLPYTIPPKEAMPSLGFYLTVILKVFSQCIRMSKDYHVYIFKDSDCACCLPRTTASIEI